MAKLLYLGQDVADELTESVASNLERYRSGDFLDKESMGNWRIPLSIDADVEILSSLAVDNGSEGEVRNSIVVGRALAGLTPTLARENRLWLRLSHVECLEYSRNRWLNAKSEDVRVERDVRKHFFASTLTACRDDHAISRLWWNYRVATQVMPDDPERALKLILARADIRQGLIERPGIGARRSLGSAIVRAIDKHEELRRNEALFRELMKKVNLNGAGFAFEVWHDNAVDGFIEDCLGEISRLAGVSVADPARA